MVRGLVNGGYLTIIKKKCKSNNNLVVEDFIINLEASLDNGQTLNLASISFYTNN